MKDITKDNFEDFIKGDGVAVIDVYADWCGPCKRMMPLVHKVESEYENKNVRFGKVNSDKEPELVEQLKVMGVPTFLFYQGGWNVSRFTGVRPINLLRQDLDLLVSGDNNGSEEESSSKENGQEVS